MPGKTRGKIHAVELSRMRHDIESEIECTAPDEFYFGVAQLGGNADHAAAEGFGALAHSIFSFREEGGAASEEHAIVRCEAVVEVAAFGVVDHAVSRAKLVREIGSRKFRCHDVR